MKRPTKRLKLLTMTDMVDILLDFDVVHDAEVLIPSEKENETDECYGATDHEGSRIMLCDRFPQGVRRLTILHELYHARDFREGYESLEKPVEKISERHYAKLFGHKFLGKRK